MYILALVYECIGLFVCFCVFGSHKESNGRLGRYVGLGMAVGGCRFLFGPSESLSRDMFLIDAYLWSLAACIYCLYMLCFFWGGVFLCVYV